MVTANNTIVVDRNKGKIVLAGNGVHAREQDRSIETLKRQIASRSAQADVEQRRADYAAAAVAPYQNPVPIAPPTPSPPAATESDAAPTEVLRRGVVSIEDRRARLDFLIEKEPIDVEARSRSRMLKGRLDAILVASSSVKSVECRSKICRIETLHRDSHAIHAFVEGAFRDSDKRLTSGATLTTSVGGVDSHGDTLLVSYIASDGEDLPDVDAM